MRQLWTREMEAELQRWQAIEEEAANPKDFLVAHDINLNDHLRGLVRYAVAAIRHRILGGWEPLFPRQQIESANIQRHLGPERLVEIAAFIHEPFAFSEQPLIRRPKPEPQVELDRLRSRRAGGGHRCDPICHSHTPA